MFQSEALTYPHPPGRHAPLHRSPVVLSTCSKCHSGTWFKRHCCRKLQCMCMLSAIHLHCAHYYAIRTVGCCRQATHATRQACSHTGLPRIPSCHTPPGPSLRRSMICVYTDPAQQSTHLRRAPSLERGAPAENSKVARAGSFDSKVHNCSLQCTFVHPHCFGRMMRWTKKRQRDALQDRTKAASKWHRTTV